jgi:soluble lytic murein transglycosylase-like protein
MMMINIRPLVLLASFIICAMMICVGTTAVSSMPSAADVVSLGTQGILAAVDQFTVADAPTSTDNQDVPVPAPSGNQPGCPLSQKYPETILQWCDLIQKYAQENELPTELIAAVMLQESGGDPLSYSESGAVGLLQVMPRDGIAASFECINGPCFSSRPSIAELQDPEYNVSFGTRMLASLIRKYGSNRDGLKYYGPAGVEYYYADKVLAIFENYR